MPEQSTSGSCTESSEFLVLFLESGVPITSTLARCGLFQVLYVEFHCNEAVLERNSLMHRAKLYNKKRYAEKIQMKKRRV